MIANGKKLSYTCDREFVSPLDNINQSIPTIKCAGGIWLGAAPRCDGKAFSTCLRLSIVSKQAFEFHIPCLILQGSHRNAVASYIRVLTLPLIFILLLLTDIDECAKGIHSCNPQTSICVNTLGGFKCFCKPGFELDASGNGCVG